MAQVEFRKGFFRTESFSRLSSGLATFLIRLSLGMMQLPVRVMRKEQSDRIVYRLNDNDRSQFAGIPSRRWVSIRAGKRSDVLPGDQLEGNMVDDASK